MFSRSRLHHQTAALPSSLPFLQMLWLLLQRPAAVPAHTTILGTAIARPWNHSVQMPQHKQESFERARQHSAVPISPWSLNCRISRIFVAIKKISTQTWTYRTHLNRKNSISSMKKYGLKCLGLPASTSTKASSSQTPVADRLIVVNKECKMDVLSEGTLPNNHAPLYLVRSCDLADRTRDTGPGIDIAQRGRTTGRLLAAGLYHRPDRR